MILPVVLQTSLNNRMIQITESLFSIFRKCTETLLQKCRIHKFFRGPDPVSGEGRGVGSLNKKNYPNYHKFVLVLRKYTNTLTAMQNSKQIPDPLNRGGEGREKLPPLEIMSNLSP